MCLYLHSVVESARLNRRCCLYRFVLANDRTNDRARYTHRERERERAKVNLEFC